MCYVMVSFTSYDVVNLNEDNVIGSMLKKILLKWGVEVAKIIEKENP